MKFRKLGFIFKVTEGFQMLLNVCTDTFRQILIDDINIAKFEDSETSGWECTYGRFTGDGNLLVGDICFL